MKKTDKKIEQRIVKALTLFCDFAQHEIPGFKWVSHRVNFNQFPESLQVICTFDHEDSISVLQKDQQADDIKKQIQLYLQQQDIVIANIDQQVTFDS